MPPSGFTFAEELGVRFARFRMSTFSNGTTRPFSAR